jgi:hypothetical protein
VKREGEMAGQSSPVLSSGCRAIMATSPPSPTHRSLVTLLPPGGAAQPHGQLQTRNLLQVA